ncbi:hypothetical protein DFP72DRAFT_1059878 [Ephemerocybe angulata]|uniref:Dynamin N-terminal domain-containing protein n=1 Tax=Ephemerocybe angulata TaxID=980116 RepID=A0A8H6IE56_9AGAR|nr:hypothetical protein DFP72DRAFT_1059878 [Tulosesus angulatus]
MAKRKSATLRWDVKSAGKDVRDLSKKLGDGMKLLSVDPERARDWEKDKAKQSLQRQRPSLLSMELPEPGKSSLVNALLGGMFNDGVSTFPESKFSSSIEDNIVPTSGLRACTSVVTKISHHKKQKICAEITFISEKEWMQELEVLLKDLAKDENTACIGDVRTDKPAQTKKAGEKLSKEVEIAWKKIHAVYPTLQLDDLRQNVDATSIINLDPSVLAKLGTTARVEGKTSGKFAEQMSPYIESEFVPSTEDGASASSPPARLWPLIRDVHIRCKANALATGAVLVDLPGVADTNVARSAIAGKYMKEAERIWVVAHITRAVDDGIAQTKQFKMQLIKGKYDARCITFIASQTDGVSCSEIISALKLHNHPQLQSIERRTKENESDRAQLASHISQKQNQINTMKAELELLKGNGSSTSHAGIKRKALWQRGSSASAKRRRSAGDSSDEEGSSAEESDLTELEDSDEEEDEEEISADESLNPPPGPPLSAMSQATSFGSRMLSEEPEMSVQERIAALERRIEAAEKEVKDDIVRDAKLANESRILQKEKNAFCSLQRSAHAKEVLKAQFKAGLLRAQEPDEDDPDPPEENSAIGDLAVFTCSSRDYLRLTGQVKGDGEPQCFLREEDTGIPELQAWCRELTREARHAAAQASLRALRALAIEMNSWIESNGKLAASGIAERLAAAFEVVTVERMGNVKEHFKEGLEDKCKEGVRNACDEVVEIVGEYFAGKHWKLSKPVIISHNGRWPMGYDLNVSLLMPFTASIAQSFGKVFKHDLFGPIKVQLEIAIITLLEEFEMSAKDLPQSERDRLSRLNTDCLGAAKQTLNDIMVKLDKTKTMQQREIARPLLDIVSGQLKGAYTTASRIGGKGSTIKQQESLTRYIDENKRIIFQKTANSIVGHLRKLEKIFAGTLNDHVTQLAQKIENRLAVLWEEPTTRDDPTQFTTREDVSKVLCDVLNKANMWLDAAKATKP